VFTTGSNAFATERKQLRMSHVRVGRRQAEPQTRSSEYDKCWQKIGERLYDGRGIGHYKDTVHTIVREDLGKRKICSRFVKHKLTDEQKAKGMETSGDFITMCDQDPFFLRTIVTGDDTW